MSLSYVNRRSYVEALRAHEIAASGESAGTARFMGRNHKDIPTHLDQPAELGNPCMKRAS